MGIIAEHNRKFVGRVLWALALPLLIPVNAALATAVNEFVFAGEP